MCVTKKSTTAFDHLPCTTFRIAFAKPFQFPQKCLFRRPWRCKRVARTGAKKVSYVQVSAPTSDLFRRQRNRQTARGGSFAGIVFQRFLKHLLHMFERLLKTTRNQRMNDQGQDYDGVGYLVCSNYNVCGGLTSSLAAGMYIQTSHEHTCFNTSNPDSRPHPSIWHAKSFAHGHGLPRGGWHLHPRASATQLHVRQLDVLKQLVSTSVKYALSWFHALFHVRNRFAVPCLETSGDPFRACKC